MSELNNLTPLEPEKITLGDKIWQFVRFAVITGGIFVVAFLAINFPAYKNIIASLLNPEAQQERGDLLIEAAGDGTEIDPSLLLSTQESEEKTTYEWLNQPVLPTDSRLVIPKLGLSVPIVTSVSNDYIDNKDWPGLEEAIQNGLRDGVVHYPRTAAPGQIGNVFITGHSSYYAWDPGKFKEVFSLLRQLEVGDVYYIYSNQRKYTYKINEKKIIPPSDVTVLQQPSDRKISTLMTCDPPGSTKNRLVMVAEDITTGTGSENENAAPSDQNLLDSGLNNLPALPSV